MKERNKAVPAVWLILIKNEKILLMKRQNTGYRDGDYNLPAGHIEPGELPKEAMIREAEEELGIRLSKKDLEFVHVSYRPKHDETGDRVDFFFLAEEWLGEVRNAEPHKCSEILWIDPQQLPQNMPAHVKKILNCLSADEIYTEIYSELDLDFLKNHGLYVVR